MIRGYGCVNKENLPQRAPEMSPVRMEQLTGLTLEALRPSDRPLFWRLGGVTLCGLQFLIGEALGLDPLTTTIPLTFAGLTFDQVHFMPYDITASSILFLMRRECVMFFLSFSLCYDNTVISKRSYI